MKTEKQVTDLLERAVDGLTKLTKDNEQPFSDKVRLEIATAFGIICTLGTVLDCDDDIRQLIAQVKLGACIRKMPWEDV